MANGYYSSPESSGGKGYLSSIIAGAIDFIRGNCIYLLPILLLLIIFIIIFFFLRRKKKKEEEKKDKEILIHS